jgi:hypothetical protein
MASKTIDFNITGHGSIWLLQPLTDAAKAWIGEHIPADAQFLGGCLAIEPCYVPAIINGIVDDGLEIE